MSEDQAAAPPREKKLLKSSYIGAPAIFQLEMACRQLFEAFGDGGDYHTCIYLVGSSMERPDWRDVDVRMMLPDEEFARLFPDAGKHWEQDPRWLVMVVSISAWMSKLTDLPIDFQFQPATHANDRHKGFRSAVGVHFPREPR